LDRLDAGLFFIIKREDERYEFLRGWIAASKKALIKEVEKWDTGHE